MREYYMNVKRPYVGEIFFAYVPFRAEIDAIVVQPNHYVTCCIDELAINTYYNIVYSAKVCGKH